MRSRSMQRQRRGHKGAGRQAKVLPAQVAAGAAPQAHGHRFSQPEIFFVRSTGDFFCEVSESMCVIFVCE